MRYQIKLYFKDINNYEQYDNKDIKIPIKIKSNL